MKISSKRSSIFFSLSFLIFILLLIVFRSGEKFYDVYNYIGMHELVSQGRSVNTELSFFLFSKLSNFLGFSYLGIFFLYALISIASKYFFLMQFFYKPVLAFFLYGVSYFILYEFVQMRVGAAFGVFLVSLVFYYRGMFLVSLAICILASFLHYSIIPLVFLLFISPIFFKANAGRFLGLSLPGHIFLLVTICFILYFILIYVFPILDFRTILVASIYDLLYWILPARLYEGYIGVDFIPVYGISVKGVLSLTLSFISIFALWFGMIKKEWVYYFSCFMVICSFWIYFFFGQFGVMAERLAEILVLFIIVVVDGFIKKDKIVGYSLFIIIFSVFLINISTRATYFNLV